MLGPICQQRADPTCSGIVEQLTRQWPTRLRLNGAVSLVADFFTLRGDRIVPAHLQRTTGIVTSVTSLATERRAAEDGPSQG
jgi:hypothetical protein